MISHSSFSYSRGYVCLLLAVAYFNLCSCSQNFDGVLCIEEERQALLHFKHGLIDDADRLASWVGEEGDCCRWAGITCDNITGHVHQLRLRGLDGYSDDASKHRLKGNLSSSLLHLKQLRHLDLSCNEFELTKVPKFIGSLGNLRYLNLSGSNFVGTIPPELGNLTELEVLCLGSIYEHYHHPGYYYSESSNTMNMQWLSNLRNLHHLDMISMNLSKETSWLQVINTIPSLVKLRMINCQLSQISPHVSNLNITSLSLLDLSGNNFNSSLPQWLFSLTNLVSLDLSGCNFHGPISSSSINGFRNLTLLKSLYVPENDFMNSSLVLEGLSSGIGSNLISLDISFCGVSSSVLDSLHNLTSLLILDLSQNHLTQTIPKSLCNFCNLKDISLFGNDFSGISLTYLLESFFKCKTPVLESLDLTSIGVSGAIPDFIGKLSFLRTLKLDGNLISGPIPISIGKLTSLEVLHLCFNQMNGSLPDSIGSLSSLKELYICYNKFAGTLPESLGQLSKLEILIFEFNLLTGVVTETNFAKLVSLKLLIGGGNNLVLRQPLEKWSPPFQLEQLFLSSWNLGPQFPLWLESQRDLFSLEISNTNISSSMPPESFWRSLPSLNYLDMSHNHIEGMLSSILVSTVPTLLLSSNNFSGMLPNLSNVSRHLDLSNNFFEGSLHNMLCPNEEKYLEALNVGNNHLSGVIPECWQKIPEMMFLNLENNNFSGHIPRTLGSSYKLQYLNMRGNKLSGRLPSSLKNLTALQILTLGGNELVGSIPTWFGRELSFLRIVNLKSNNFDGNIPHEICYLTHIQVLELADNNLSGNIPRCFNNFSVLSGKDFGSFNDYHYNGYSTGIITSDSLVTKGREDTYTSIILRQMMLLDLSNNNLSGNIPSELKALTALHTLNFSRNQLTGRIPVNIGDMKSLETLDLSVNKLSGELPMSLSTLNFLSNFNVSSNHLTGRIPSSTQLQSFTESSFFGNNLCGDPLTASCTSVEVTDIKDSEDDDGLDGADWALIISIVLGFIVGFWVIVAPLLLSRSWRIAYFRFMSEFKYMIYDVMHKYRFKMFSK